MTHAPSNPVLYSFPDGAAVVKNLASFILKAQFEAIDKRGKFSLALSGGSLPKMLAGLVDSPQVEWEKWHIFFADERVVRLDHEDSNYLLCQNELFSKIPQIPRENIHAINLDVVLPDSLDKEDNAAVDSALAALDDDALEEVADDYESQLIAAFAQKDSARFPVFDLILLGMGPDGHTASLFPGHQLLTEEGRWIAYISDSPKPPPKRITFTMPVINHAAKVAFVATGAGKQEMLSRVFDHPEEGLPSSRVRPKTPGGVFWFVDDAASAQTEYAKTPFKL